MPLTLPQIGQPLKVWEKLEIILEERGTRGLYVARIEDFINGGIIITNPEFVEGNSLLRDNCPVTVHVTRADAVYEFLSRIRRLGPENKGRLLLTPPDHITRVQRRQFVRIEYFSKVELAVIDMGGQFTDFKWQNALTVNVSGGGMLVKGHLELASRQLLLVKGEFLAEVGILVPVAAICRRCHRRDMEQHAGIELIRSDYLSIHFGDSAWRLLPEAVNCFGRNAQEKLVNYIFKQQIVMRRKGLI